ncbi:MAG: DUF1822 family protein [Symploca sp. SIO3E6]|nr:DUF1822 family protein [Caldora sp. SIO3E6]
MLDFDVLQGEIIPLESEYYTQAIEISDRVAEPERQWQAYLNILALRSFTEWLAARAGNIRVNQAVCSALHPELAQMPDLVYPLKVGEFQVCLIAKESLIDHLVRIPKEMIELPEFAAHFYVIMEVLEEEEQASIRGFLHYNQLPKVQELTRLAAAPETGIYELPLNLFDTNANNLLLNLSLSEPAALKIRQKAEGRRQKEQEITIQSERLIQQAVNVGIWLREEIDELARSLGWGMPGIFTPAVASGWRSTENFADAIAILIDQGLNIPPEARGSYQRIFVDETPLQLFAGVWRLMAEEAKAEWSLLLILGTESGGFLPQGIKLQVRDQTQIISEQVLEVDNFYLGSHVVGNLDEQFSVTITLNGKELKLPPFVFSLNW